MYRPGASPTHPLAEWTVAGSTMVSQGRVFRYPEPSRGLTVRLVGLVPPRGSGKGQKAEDRTDQELRQPTPKTSALFATNSFLGAVCFVPGFGHISNSVPLSSFLGCNLCLSSGVICCWLLQVTPIRKAQALRTIQQDVIDKALQGIGVSGPSRSHAISWSLLHIIPSTDVKILEEKSTLGCWHA